MTPVSSFSFPSVAEIEEIAAITDGVARNDRITYAYYRLNQAMKAVAGERDLSWCGFATWASKTAGVYISGQEVPSIVEDWIDHATAAAGAPSMLLAHALGIHSERPGDENAPGGFSLRAFATGIIGGVANAIAGGNQAVFRDITPKFSALLSLWASNPGAIPDGAKRQFLESLRGGDPPDYLYRAFAAMLEAAENPGSRACAQAMCYANTLVACVEQTLAQSYIVASMNAPVDDLLLQRLDTHLHSRFSDLIAKAMKEALKPLAHAFGAEFGHLCTEWIMRLNLADGSVRLGLDVPPPPDCGMYPEELDALDAPEPLQTMTLLDALQAAGSGASDWTSYPQRMRYIAVLFRSRQQQPLLWNAPFTQEELAQLVGGSARN